MTNPETKDISVKTVVFKSPVKALKRDEVAANLKTVRGGETLRVVPDDADEMWDNVPV